MSFFKKLLIGLILIPVIGVPIVETWKFFLLSMAWIGLLYATPKLDARRLLAVLTIVVVVLIVKSLLPHAEIEEGHNVFVTLNEGEVLERELPEKVFNSWKRRFDALYTPKIASTKPYTWKSSAIPDSLFVHSSDANFREAKYSRQVDSIYFNNLWDFRGGFSNEGKYNYWQGEMSRREMPFFVMYEFSEASVGSSITWKGQIFWEEKKGEFREINHIDVSSKEITSNDIGMRLFAMFTPKVERSIYFKLDKSIKLQLIYFLDSLLTIFATVFVLMITMKVQKSPWIRSGVIFSSAYLIMVLLLSMQAGKLVENSYPPHGGGDDGLVHESWGRVMALHIAEGDIVEALRGVESVYWFTPGTRYFRMVEKLIFGDTNLGYALVLSFFPILIFHLFNHLTNRQWSLSVTAIFMLLPVGNFNFLNYVANGAKLGYGEAIAGFMFLLGLLLALKTEPKWGGRYKSLSLVWLCGALLAASMFVRPNFAFAVVALALLYSWGVFNRRDYFSIAALFLGLSLAWWMPFHNWFYGNEFYLISKSGSTIMITIGIQDYLSAIVDLLSGEDSSHSLRLAKNQINAWLFDLGLVVKNFLAPVAWGYLLFKLVAFIIMTVFSLHWLIRSDRIKNSDIFVIATLALSSLAPLMVIFSTHYRYALLGWDLMIMSFIVLLFRVYEIEKQ